MRQIGTVFRRDFPGYFRTPVGYVLLSAFVLASVGLAFFLGDFFTAGLANLDRYLVYFPWLFLFLAPAVGMRLWAEEKRSGTLELLLTLPMSPAEAVVGKFLAAWTFLGVAILLGLPMAATIGYLGHPDWGVVASSYAGTFLLAGAYLAIACFASALTRNQVVSFVLSAALSAVLLFLGWSVFSRLLEGFLPVPVVDALANFSFVTHYHAFLRGCIEAKDAVFFISLIAFFLALNVLALERPRRRWLSAALLVAALGLVNGVAAGLPLRIEATAERIYTLSGGTRAILAGISQPIDITVYYSRSAENLPIEYKNYASRVGEMLRQYARESGGKITIRYVDPEPDTAEEERATLAGIQMQRTEVGAAPFYFGIVATQAARQKSLPAMNPRQERVLEYDLSRLIAMVQQSRKKRLGLISGVPLAGVVGNPLTGQEAQEPQFVVRQWQQTFDLVPIPASASALPPNLDVLAIIHPERLSAGLRYAIDQYLMSGGPMFLAVDPVSEFFRRKAAALSRGFGDPQPNVASDLPGMLGAWGIAFDPRQAIGDNHRAAQITDDTGSLIRQPAWLDLSHDDVAAGSPITAKLAHLLFVWPGSISLKPGSALSFTPLASTSRYAGSLDARTAPYAPTEKLASLIAPSGKRTLAALVSGRFGSAFPSGPPAGAPTVAGPNRGRRSGRSTMVVVADTDWLFDEFSVRTYGFMGTVGVQPLDDNLALAANALDYLSGSRELLSIRGKGSSLRPFTVVAAMEAKAREKYRRKMEGLEAQLSAGQAKLAQFQSQRPLDGSLAASPEVARPMAEVPRKGAALRAERRASRLALRQDVDTLEDRLLAVNMLAGPVLVGIFGVWYVRRRRRQRPPGSSARAG